MYRNPNVQKPQCTETPMYRNPNVQKSQCTEAPPADGSVVVILGEEWNAAYRSLSSVSDDSYLRVFGPPYSRMPQVRVRNRHSVECTLSMNGLVNMFSNGSTQ
jgi:hypothetical protein